METNQVKYLGLSANTSDYECHDGELSAAVNLINEDGTLKPLPQPKEILSLLSSRRILYIHTSATFRHYIIRETNTTNLLWADANVSTISYTQFDTGILSILSVSSIGNTLILLTPDGIFYYNFKPDTGNYKALGQKPPMVQLQFGLGDNHKANWDRSGVAVLQTSGEYNYAWLGTGYEYNGTINQSTMTATKAYFQDSIAERITDKVWSLINKANNLVSSQGRFYAPFFVRYCYRLYDGSTIMHSAPVFMPLSSPKSFCVELAQLTFSVSGQAIHYLGDSRLFQLDNDGDQQIDEQIQTNSFTFRMRPCNVSLDYKVLRKTIVDDSTNPATTSYDYVIPELIEDWGDIVKSIDIFVSQPIIREKNNETIKSATVSDDFIRLNNGLYNIRQFDQLITQGELAPEYDYVNVVCDIPMLTESEYLKRIQDTSAFFKVASFKPDELIYGDNDSLYQHPISIPSEVLSNLAVQEAMIDDYNSHNSILPYLDSSNKCLTSLFNYNSRLNISCIKEQLFEGFPAEVLVPRAIAYNYEGIALNVLKVYVYIKTGEGQKIVCCDRFNNGDSYKPGSVSLYSCPLFYPDNRAFQMDLLVDESGTNKIYRLPMTQHAFLNGSITSGHIISDGSVSFNKLTPSTVTIADTLSLPNYIYSSEVNNPFLFRPENIHTVGTGLILGIAAATKALSQGQFGQFPLYAFASDGVWALSVNTDGSFNTIHPVSRDVCTNPDSITSIDNAVLFATSRGIMLIQGSDTVCITDPLLSASPFSLSSLIESHQGGTINYLATLLQSRFGWQADILTSLFPQLSAFLPGARLVYDYANQRIIVYNPTEIDDTRPDGEGGTVSETKPLFNFAFVYSLLSHLWSSMRINLSYSLNSYPDALAVTRDNMLVSFSDSQLAETNKQLLISRPLKLGMSDTLKSINHLIQRGIFQRGKVCTLLYASRDLIHWYLVASSTNHEIHGLHGTPWRYYRIVALATNLTSTDSVSGASLQLTPKYTNALR